MKETFEQYLERLRCSQVTFEGVAKSLFEAIEQVKVMKDLYWKAEERIRELEAIQLASVTPDLKSLEDISDGASEDS